MSVTFQNRPVAESSSSGEDSNGEQANHELVEFLHMKERIHPETSFQNVIDLAEKKQTINIGERTQALLEDMEIQVDQDIRKKRKITPKKKESDKKKKKIPQTPIQEDAEPHSFLGILELIWTVSVYRDIMKVLGEQKAMSQKNLLLKRDFMKLISLWKTILQSTVHKLRATKCEDLSWNACKSYPLRYSVVYDIFAIQYDRYIDSYISRICEFPGGTSCGFKDSIFWVCNHNNDHLEVVHDSVYVVR